MVGEHMIGTYVLKHHKLLSYAEMSSHLYSPFDTKWTWFYGCDTESLLETLLGMDVEFFLVSLPRAA